MIFPFRHWRARREQRKRSMDFARGYEYAAGFLLRNAGSSTNTVRSFQTNVEDSLKIDPTPFDKGSLMAIHDWETRVYVLSDLAQSLANWPASESI